MDSYPFSLLRIELDARRGEVVNVGVVVFLPDRLDVRLIPAGPKLRALDPNYDAQHLANLDEWLQHVDSMSIGDSAEIRHGLLAASGGVELGPLAYFRLPTLAAYESQVDSLLEDLVTPPPNRELRATRFSRLETQLRRDFSKRGLFSSNIADIEKHKIVARYTVSAEENLIADFALRNGKLHVFAAVDFRGSPDTVRVAKFGASAIKAITLDRAKALKQAARYAVIAAPDDVMELAHPHISILRDYSDRVFNIFSNSDHEALMDHVTRASRAH